MPEMIPTRDGFGKGLLELGQQNKDVVVLCADLTDSTRAGWFKEKFPSRFFGFGVAEQDMLGAAAGLALMGKIPFACTFGVFASGRASDSPRWIRIVRGCASPVSTPMPISARRNPVAPIATPSFPGKPTAPRPSKTSPISGSAAAPPSRPAAPFR